MPDKLTEEEYAMLAKSPADAPHLTEDPASAAEEAPEGVVEDDEGTSA
jgi:hypothetical protein